LQIWEQQFGPDHPEVACALSGLASLYRKQGKYARAEPLYQRALWILEQQSGPDHPEVACALNGLANLYRKQGKYARAEPLYQRALQIWEQQFGPDHKFTRQMRRRCMLLLLIIKLEVKAKKLEGKGNS
jgi:tetratricopeptide (TPR) repeat protein